jgi:hypothetical protein
VPKAKAVSFFHERMGGMVFAPPRCKGKEDAMKPVSHNGRAKKEHIPAASNDGQAPTKKSPQDIAASYNEFKEYEGRRYTGVKVGRGHKWYYDQGEWNEKKITPDQWQFTYAVKKRRAGKAPEGSGVPVGTEYHWYILAHQNVRKLNANDYDTSMTGMKFKVAHKRADTEKWSASERAQRKRMIQFLREMIEELEKQADADQPVRPSAKSPSRRRKRTPVHA